jgi:arsenate reductase-like glutaredoxin family protein
MNSKIDIDPDWLLEWLIDRGYVEETDSAFSPYRIATNPETDRPYTVTSIVKSLRTYKKNLARSDHSRPFCRELKKCFDEYHITYMSLTDHALLCMELKPNRLKELEEKLGVNLDPLSKVERKRLSVLYSRNLKSVGKDEAMKRMYLYIQRRLNNPGADLRRGKVQKIESMRDVNLEDLSNSKKLHYPFVSGNHQDQASTTESIESILATSGTLFNRFSNCNCDYDDQNGHSYDDALNEYCQ